MLGLISLAVTALAVTFANLTCAARADEVSAVTNIWFGTVTLYSASDVLLSTTNVMSVETSVGAGSPATLNLLGNDLATQIAADHLNAITPVPSWVLSGVAGFVSNNGLGLAWDGGTVPTPAELALDTLLTTQPVPFTITIDTGIQAFDASIVTTYESGPFASDPSLSFLTNVNFYTRDVTEVENATPLPATLPLFVTGLGGLALLGWRRKRRAQAAA